MIPLEKLYSIRKELRDCWTPGCLEALLDAMIEDAEYVPVLAMTKKDNPDTSDPSCTPDKLYQWGTSKGLNSKTNSDRT